MKDKIINFERHRIGTDGGGISTLVIFPGCPLKCKYCINNYCHDNNIKTSEYSANELYETIKIDEIYFKMTHGGVVFGGGEPLLHSSFIREFSDHVNGDWEIRIETSLNCDWEYIEPLVHCIDKWIIDIKDLDPQIYKAYTGVDNTLVISNISKLSALVEPTQIVFRIPVIPGFNNVSNQMKNFNQLKKLGKTDLLTYLEITN